MNNNLDEEKKYLDFDESSFIENQKRFVVKEEEGFDELSTALHEHNFAEVMILLEGSIAYCMKAGQFILKPYDCFFIPPHFLHKLVVLDKNTKYKRIVLRIYPSHVKEISTPLTDLNEQLYLFTSKGNFLIRDIDFGIMFRNNLRHIIDLENNGTYGNDILIRNELSTIFLSLSGYLLIEENEKILPTGNPKIIEVAEYISSHINEDLRIPFLANLVGLDEYYLSHLFSKEIGITIHQFIIKKRLSTVKKMIDQNVSLKEIAQQVGFKDSSHLIQSFKKEYGITPNRYKQLIMEHKSV